MKIANLVEESIPFIHPCRCTRFTRVCFPINNTSIPKTSVFKDADHIAHEALTFLAERVWWWGFSGSQEFITFYFLWFPRKGNTQQSAAFFCHILFLERRHGICPGSSTISGKETLVHCQCRKLFKAQYW